MYIYIYIYIYTYKIFANLYTRSGAGGLYLIHHVYMSLRIHVMLYDVSFCLN